MSVSVGGNRLNEKAARALASMVAVRNNWLRLELSQNPLGDAGVVALSSAGLQQATRLGTLDLMRVGLSHKGAVPLLKAVSNLPSLKLLNLKGRSVGVYVYVHACVYVSPFFLCADNLLSSDKLASSLAGIVQRAASLTSLDLRGTKLGSKTSLALLTAVAKGNVPLEQFLISHVTCCCHSCVVVVNSSWFFFFFIASFCCDAFFVCCFFLFFVQCTLDEKAQATLTECVKALSESLKALCIAACALKGARFAAALRACAAHALKLETLEIADNELRGDECEAALGTLLERTSALQTLDASGCSLVASGYKALATALQHNDTLHMLQLDGNGIGPNALTAIARALRGHQSLRRLSFACLRSHHRRRRSLFRQNQGTVVLIAAYIY